MLTARLFALGLLFASSALSATAQSTSTTLTATPASVKVGGSVALSAAVVGSQNSADSPHGTLAVYDGSPTQGGTSIGTAPLIGATVASPTAVPLATMLGAIDPAAAGVLLSADFNGDGKADVISYGPIPYSSASASTAFQVFLNNGSGSFTTKTAQTYRLISPVIIDFNHDGKLDIVSLSPAASGAPDGANLQVFLGDGVGGFAAPITPPGFTPAAGPLGSAYFSTMATADLEGNGLPYLLLGNWTGTYPDIQNAILAYRNNADGTFSLAGVSPVYLASTLGQLSISKIVTADLNGDGKLDAIIDLPERATTPHIGVLTLGNGDGTFAPGSATFAPQSCSAVCNGGFTVVTADFNGDGKKDVAVSSGAGPSAGSDDLYVYLGHGDGTFADPLASASVLIAPTNPSNFNGIYVSIIATDIDGDGKQDLVDSAGYAYLGKGDGTFTSTSNLAGATFWTQIYSTTPSFGMLQADLNADGLADYYFSFTNVLNISRANLQPTVVLGRAGSIAQLSTSSLTAGMHSLYAVYGGGGVFQGSTSPSTPVSVSQQQPTVTGASSPNPALIAQPVTLAVKVSAPSVRPTGAVTFTAGSTTLGTATLDVSGNASITYTFATVGTQTVTASYAGDANTAAASVVITATTVNAFTLSPSSANTTLTTSRGGSATSAIVVASQNGFSGSVAFTCSGLPTGASCSFSPASVTVSGAASGNTTMTVAVTSTVSLLRNLRRNSGDLMLAGVCLIGIAGASRRRRLVSNTLIALAVSVTLIGAAGCSGGGSSSTATAKTYTFNVTATSGAAQTTTAYTLNVQ
ncbi:FG-GAP-like repeat-containing protein [Terriglobus roseus]|uniref:Repeat domain-containing protein n=1 Tax=Terriglobus roseus TaxID=392734 RepID=A0A1H4NCT6_9BACT|nr:FG-GAP-like repeat-containing protein [Terriglobus roseus]SEB92924.1 Repeat domain-containing protein [Terriglobus roseus]